MEKENVLLVCEPDQRELIKKLRLPFNVVEPVKDAETIVVIGGDGVMHRAIRKYRKLGLPFLGLHMGGLKSTGFLLNDLTKANLADIRHARSEFIYVKLLAADCYLKNGAKKRVYAFTDLYFERASTQVIKVTLAVNGHVYFDPIQCDAMLACTPAGSTAYNANADGAILSIDNFGMILTAVAPQKRFGWKTATLSENDRVTLELQEQEKRPARFVADGIKIGSNIKKAEIFCSDETVRIIFAKGNDYRKKVQDLIFLGRTAQI